MPCKNEPNGKLFTDTCILTAERFNTLLLYTLSAVHKKNSIHCRILDKIFKRTIYFFHNLHFFSRSAAGGGQVMAKLSGCGSEIKFIIILFLAHID